MPVPRLLELLAQRLLLFGRVDRQLDGRVGNAALLILAIDDCFSLGSQQALDIGAERGDEIAQMGSFRFQLAMMHADFG